ncbi:MAG: hypothetical protein R3F38_12325 [Gammaproteobacteria bacterium]
MVHGGLRYIAQGDIALTRHSALERERLIREARGLVERMGYLFPIRKGQFPGKLLFSILLTFYDTLAGIRTHGWHSADAVRSEGPGIRRNGLKGANYYTDAVTDDARLVLRVLQQACAERAGTELCTGERICCGTVVARSTAWWCRTRSAVNRPIAARQRGDQRHGRLGG